MNGYAEPDEAEVGSGERGEEDVGHVAHPLVSLHYHDHHQIPHRPYQEYQRVHDPFNSPHSVFSLVFSLCPLTEGKNFAKRRRWIHVVILAVTIGSPCVRWDAAVASLQKGSSRHVRPVRAAICVAVLNQKS